MKTLHSGHPYLILAIAVSLSLAVGVGCTNTAPTNAGCSSSTDCVDGYLCVTGACVEVETDAAGDIIEDTDDDPGFQIDVLDDQSSLDLTPVDASDVEVVEPGTFGAPCSDDIDCDSRYCIEVSEEGERQCTELCRDDCPDGFECRLLSNTGSDAVRICVPERNVLCDPCDIDADCGLFGVFCLEQLDGTFCATDCSVDETCPSDFTCQKQDVPGPDDSTIEVQVCLPDLGVCGNCYDPDTDGYGIGLLCLGDDCAEGEISINPDADEVCNGLDDDCNDGPDEDFDLTTSSDHCGACNRSCHPGDLDEVVASHCAESGCVVDECSADHADCNTDGFDGCEIDFLAPTTCGTTCADAVDCSDLRHVAAASCDELGSCVIDGCVGGFVHCSDDPKDGCEIDLGSVDTCGTTCEDLIDCEVDVPGVATGTCSEEGVCGVEECLPGWANCTTDEPLDGCETAIWTATSCGTGCDDPINCEELANVDEVGCTEGMCVITECDPGWFDCDSDTPGCETFLWGHGACANACEDTPIDCSADSTVEVGLCEAGTCVVDTCVDGRGDCNLNHGNGCEVDLHDDAACRATCEDSPLNCSSGTGVREGVCSDSGECVVTDCETGFDDCHNGWSDGCEVNRFSDTSCGSGCGDLEDCTEAQHGNGACEITTEGTLLVGVCEVSSCSLGYDDCDDDPSECETSVWEDNYCGSRCSNAVNCSDSEINVQDGHCVEGGCVLDQCLAGWDDCDATYGCESSVWEDDYCGSSCANAVDCDTYTKVEVGRCVVVEDAAHCEASVCQDGWGSCDEEPADCEQYLWADDSCGTTCTRVDCDSRLHVFDGSCQLGQCVANTCDAGYLSCDDDPGDCEELIWDDNACGTNCLTRVDCDALAHVESGTCGSGTCGSFVCQEGWGNCGEGEGCETDIWHDNNCGLACGSTGDCDNLPHTKVGECNRGVCESETCDDGWADCSDESGCDTNLWSLATCGTSCNEYAECEFTNAEADCNEGTCEQGPCTGGYKDVYDDYEGCEYGPCSPVPWDDIPDWDFSDTDCDGIDGEVARAYFVSPVGSDSNPGTRESPFGSIQHAVDQAEDDPDRDHVYVAVGEYPIASPLELPSGVSLFGQYDPTNWTNPFGSSRTRSGVTKVLSSGPVALLVESYAGIGYIQGMTFESDDADDEESSRAAIIEDVTGSLTITYTNFIAGLGGDGVDGQSAASQGNPGEDGGPGTRGCSGNISGSGYCADDNAPGGSGNTQGCGDGGTGGTGRWGEPGLEGAAGTQGDGSGGAGGTKGSGGPFTGDCCYTEGGDGTVGGPGGDGTDGTNGTQPVNQNRGTLSTRDWQAGDGTSGGSGKNGGGGGGGGAGAGGQGGLREICAFGGCACANAAQPCFSDLGGGGGGGGSGGCRGSAGTAGSGAGGSIALLAIRANGLHLENNYFETAGGGAGGDGGNATPGGLGGDGGSGGSEAGADDAGAGGPGGRGGHGGNGSGGAGGMSVGILTSDSPSIDVGTNSTSLGDGGDGGDGGSFVFDGDTISATDGATGYRATRLDL